MEKKESEFAANFDVNVLEDEGETEVSIIDWDVTGRGVVLKLKAAWEVN